MSLGLNNFDQAKALSDQTAEFQKKIRALEAELAAAKQVARYNEDVAGDAINSLREANKRIAELEAQWSNAYDVWAGATNIEGIRADERRTAIEEVAVFFEEGSSEQWTRQEIADAIRAKFFPTASNEAKES